MALRKRQRHDVGPQHPPIKPLQQHPSASRAKRTSSTSPRPKWEHLYPMDVKRSALPYESVSSGAPCCVKSTRYRHLGQPATVVCCPVTSTTNGMFLLLFPWFPACLNYLFSICYLLCRDLVCPFTNRINIDPRKSPKLSRATQEVSRSPRLPIRKPSIGSPSLTRREFPLDELAQVKLPFFLWCKSDGALWEIRTEQLQICVKVNVCCKTDGIPGATFFVSIP